MNTKQIFLSMVFSLNIGSLLSIQEKDTVEYKFETFFNPHYPTNKWINRQKGCSSISHTIPQRHSTKDKTASDEEYLRTKRYIEAELDEKFAEKMDHFLCGMKIVYEDEININIDHLLCHDKESFARFAKELYQLPDEFIKK